jgi:hypothetical protein
MATTALKTEAPALTDSERTPCEVWTRVMGYYRPITYMNPGKQSENAERVCFKEPPACVLEPTGQMKLGI